LTEIFTSGPLIQATLRPKIAIPGALPSGTTKSTRQTLVILGRDALMPECHNGPVRDRRAMLRARDQLAEKPGVGIAERTAYSADGVDLTLIRWMLSMSPAKRLETLERTLRSLARLRPGRIPT